MTIDWPQVGTLLFGAFLALLGAVGAELIRGILKDRTTRQHVVRRLRTQMSGLIRSLRNIEKNGHKGTEMFGLLMVDLKEWRAQLLQDREKFSYFKDPDFERALINWHFEIRRLIVVSDGIDAGGEQMRAEGNDPTARLIAWREGLVQHLTEQAVIGDRLLKDLDKQ